jgi:hypothetical protein
VMLGRYSRKLSARCREAILHSNQPQACCPLETTKPGWRNHPETKPA